MPIEIHELVIKATVDNQGKGDNTSSDTDEAAAGGQQQLINICVEKVMEIIQSKTDR